MHICKECQVISTFLESLHPPGLHCACLASPHGSTATSSTPPHRWWREGGGAAGTHCCVAARRSSGSALAVTA